MRTKAWRMVLVAVVFVFAAAGAWAGTNTWTNTGPEGGTVNRIVFAQGGGTAYAAAGGGVFKSTDGGLHWTDASAGLTLWYLMQLAADPSSPGTLYATGRGGVNKTTDGGAHWAAVNTGLGTSFTGAIGIGPAPGTTLYVSDYSGAVYKTVDAGASWSVTGTLGGTYVQALVVDPAHPATVFAGCGSGGIFKSGDGGTTWAPSNAGLANTQVKSLAFDASTSPATLYAGTSGGGVFKSTDGGDTWNAASAGLTSLYVAFVTLEPGSSSKLYAATSGGVFKSTDGAAAWSQVSFNLSGAPLCVAVDPSNTSTVLMGSNRGAYRSSDGGDHWAAANTGLYAQSVIGIAVDPRDSRAVYATTDDGLCFKSTDAGATWASASTGLNGYRAWIIVADPLVPDTLYIATDGAGVYKTSDGGAHWAPSGPNVPGSRYCYGLDADPSTVGTLYATLYYNGVFKSTDGGATWNPATTQPSNPHMYSVAVDPLAPTIVYAANPGQADGIYKSTDGGVNFYLSGTGITGLSPHSIAVDPHTPGTVYAAGGGSILFKSTNGGVSWAALPPSGVSGTFYSLVRDPSTPNQLYAVANGGGVAASPDGGATWTVLNDGLANLNTRRIAVDPRNPGRLYLASPGRGVYVMDRCSQFTCAASVPAAGTAGTAVSFWALASCAAGAVTYDWNFGDGSTHSSEQNPSHTYASANTYTWGLAVTDGVASCSKFGSITVAGNPPAVTLVSPGSGTLAGGTAVNVYGAHFTGVSGVTFGTAPAASFTFDNDGLVIAVSPAHAEGTVDIRVTTPHGTSAVTAADHFTYIQPCTVTCTATVPATGTAGSAVAFASTATPSNCSGTVTYDWNFGDGSTHSSEQNPSHTYASANTYTWGLAVTDGVASCSKFGSITVAGNPPAVTLVSPGSGTLAGGTAVNVYGAHFTGVSGVTFGTAPAASFTFDNDGLVIAASPAHAEGTVDIRVTTPHGTSAVTAADHFTYIQPCTVTCTATVPATGTAGSAVAFASTATPSNCSGTVTYDWNFGDGSTHSSEQNPSHTYASANTYTWGLAVSDGVASCSKSGSITVASPVPPPVITLIKKVAPPFKLVVTGSNLQNGIQVLIGGDPWSNVIWKKTSKVKIAGGALLKAKVPKGATTTFTFINPDGGRATATFAW